MNESFEAQPNIGSEDLVLALLEETDNLNPPTNPQRMAKYLNLSIKEFDDSSGLNSKILAYLWPEREEIGVRKGLPPSRKIFSILHEIGHFVLPGHVIPSEARIEDSSASFGYSKKLSTREREANQFAADCLFQLDGFDRQVVNVVLNWTNIQLYADRYMASYEATARRWVERTIKECALIVFNPVLKTSLASADLEIFYTITSKSFREKYFYSLTPGQKLSHDSLAYKVFNHLEEAEQPEERLAVSIGDTPQQFRMRLFSNSYRMFGLLTPIN